MDRLNIDQLSEVINLGRQDPCLHDEAQWLGDEMYSEAFYPLPVMDPATPGDPIKEAPVTPTPPPKPKEPMETWTQPKGFPDWEENGAPGYEWPPDNPHLAEVGSKRAHSDVHPKEGAHPDVHRPHSERLPTVLKTSLA